MASTSAEGGGMKVESVSGIGGGEGVGADGTEQAVVGMVRMGASVSERDKQKMIGFDQGAFVAAKKARRERVGSTAKERISKMPPCTAGKRSSIYRGVTRHRWTGRYEAHLWDKSTWNQNQNKKGKQVYLGAYDDEEVAARAYDLAALKYWGPGTLINFPVSDYTRDLEEMQNVSREEYLASLRRKSSGFSRGISKYRGLSSGRWEPSLGRASGSEYLQSLHYGPTGDSAAADNEYGGGVCIERKIDLTGYIKWWVPNNRFRAGDISKTPEGMTRHMTIDEVSNELKPLERAILSTEPYQMPKLGTAFGGKKTKGGGSPLSALSILSRSPSYRSLQERCSKAKEAIVIENNENENKSNIVDRIQDQAGNVVEKSTILESGVSHHPEEASTVGEVEVNRNMFPLSPLLSAPLLTGYGSIDPLADPMLWSSLMPVLPGGPSSQSVEVTKSENSSSFTIFRQEEG